MFSFEKKERNLRELREREILMRQLRERERPEGERERERERDLKADTLSKINRSSGEEDQQILPGRGDLLC